MTSQNGNRALGRVLCPKIGRGKPGNPPDADPAIPDADPIRVNARGSHPLQQPLSASYLGIGHGRRREALGLAYIPTDKSGCVPHCRGADLLRAGVANNGKDTSDPGRVLCGLAGKFTNGHQLATRPRAALDIIVKLAPYLLCIR